MAIPTSILAVLVCCCILANCQELSRHRAPVESRKAFYDTVYGQVHYKYGGKFECTGHVTVCYTFLLLHGNPRSMDEFTELIPELASRLGNGTAYFSFIAMDMLGEGGSDDPQLRSGYVTMEQYSELMIEIAQQVFTTKGAQTPTGKRYIIPFGSLTGTAIATEVAYRLNQNIGVLCPAEACEVLTLILHDPMYYFTDQIVDNVHAYAEQQKNWEPQANGQHLIAIWNDSNYQPFQNLSLQDRKSKDRLRAATTQWQVILSFADYSSKTLLSRLAILSHPSKPGPIPPLLLLYGGAFLNDPLMVKYFKLPEMRRLIASATNGGAGEYVVDGGNQAALSQNATEIADIVQKHLNV